jgi:hypothetical protein
MGGAKSFQSFDDFRKKMDLLLSDKNFYTNSAGIASKYVKDNAGATEIIIKEILGKDINSGRS